MPRLRCARCQGYIENDPDLAGQQVNCPHCGAALKMPGSMAAAGELLEPTPPPVTAVLAIQVPPLVVMTGHTPQTRLHSGGWFTRSFGVAAGILTALLLFTLGICGGLMMLGQSATFTAIANDPKLTAEAHSLSSPILRKHGVANISDDAVAYVGNDGCTHFGGTGKSSAGKPCKFHVRYQVATFEAKRTWLLRTVMIDRRIVYDSRHSE